MRLTTVAACLTALIATLCTSAPAQAEVVQKSDAGFVVRQVAVVPVGPYAAWAALTAPAKWWNPEHSWSGKAENLYIDSQATGCFCELLPVPDGAPEGTRRGSVEHMHIIQSRPGAVLRMVGALGPLQSEAVNAVLTITLKETPDGTRILWEYVVGGYMRYKTDQIAPMVDHVIGEQLARLAVSLGAEPPKPEVAEKPADAPAAPVPATAPEAPAAPEAAPAPLKPAISKPAAKPAVKRAGAAKPRPAVAKPVPALVAEPVSPPAADPAATPQAALAPEPTADSTLAHAAAPATAPSAAPVPEAAPIAEPVPEPAPAPAVTSTVPQGR